MNLLAIFIHFWTANNPPKRVTLYFRLLIGKPAKPSLTFSALTFLVNFP